MQNILKRIPFGGYQEFRRMAMETCGWSYDQWHARISGRVSLKPAERQVLEGILKQMYNNMGNKQTEVV